MVLTNHKTFRWNLSRPPRFLPAAEEGTFGYVDAGDRRTDPAGNRADRDVVSPEEFDQELRILASQTFARSRRLQDLLRYTVERIKTGRTDSIKEYLLAVEVFDRKPSFDPRFDSIVRVQASRLREKLEKYYATESARR